MAFKKKSYPVHARDLEAFAKLPVSFAILIDANYMTHWPHEWTGDGNRSRRRHADERRGGYDADQVLHEATWRLRYTLGDDGACGMKPRADTTIPYQRIGLMRGEVQDREEGDLA